MFLIIFFTTLVTLCLGLELEISARPRNFSIELIYFTRLDHFVISPLIVWTEMKSVYLGANAVTKREIKGALRMPNKLDAIYDIHQNLIEKLFQSKQNGVELTGTTFIFQDEDINILPSFKNEISRYAAKFKILNFQDTTSTTNIANRYIKNIFPSMYNVFREDDFIGPSVVMSNIIYFRGVLSIPFAVSNTVEEIIYNEDKTAIGSVSMMHQKSKLKYSNFKSLNSYILELPYGDNGRFCMLLILPYTGNTLEDVYLKLVNTTLRVIFSKLEEDVKEFGLQEVDVKLPRFRMRTSVNLHKALNDMGVYDSFLPEYSNFAGISPESLYIHSVEHTADIIFSEAETVVFATTAGYLDNKPSSSNTKANQPFIFFLVEKLTATVIFGGKYSEHRYLNELNSRVVFNE